MARLPQQGECGAYPNYTAPDPGTATPGSITFGFLGTPEIIAADATISPAAVAMLPNLAGGVPTAISVTRDGGQITGLGFAPQCTITGPVIYVPDLLGPGMGAHVVAGDRLFTPDEQLVDNPGMAALLGIPLATGDDLSVTFSIDVNSGIPTGLVGTLSASGAVTVLGDIETDGVSVGPATLVGDIIDSASAALLSTAAAEGREATVDITANGARTCRVARRSSIS